MNILVFGKDGQLGKAFKAVFDASKAVNYIASPMLAALNVI